MPAKDGLINLESFGLKNTKVTEAAFANQEAADEFPVIEGKGYLPEEIFNTDEWALFWKEIKGHKGPLLVSKRSEHENLSQEGIG